MDRLEPKSGSDRQRKYRENNKEKVKLSDAKKKFNNLKRMMSDPGFAETTKEKNRLRKQKQREKEKISQANI